MFVALPKFTSSALYKSAVGIIVVLVSNDLIIFLSTTLGTHLIYNVSVGWLNSCIIFNVKSLLECITG